MISAVKSGGQPEQSAQARRSRVGVCGSEETTQLRYHQTKATKCGGMGHRKSELSIVPVKQGNTLQWTLWREGRVGLRSRCRERRREP